MFEKKDKTKERWNKLVEEIAPKEVYKKRNHSLQLFLKIVGAA